MMVKGVTLSGPLFLGAAVDDGRRLLVAVMIPMIHLAVRYPQINDEIMHHGWPQDNSEIVVGRRRGDDD